MILLKPLWVTACSEVRFKLFKHSSSSDLKQSYEAGNTVFYLILILLGAEVIVITYHCLLLD